MDRMRHVWSMCNKHALASATVAGFFVVVLAVWGIPTLALTFLAGGVQHVDGEVAISSILYVLWPVSLVFTIVVVMLERVLRYGPEDHIFSVLRPWRYIRFWLPGWVSGAWYLLFFAPIELNLASHVVRWCGLPHYASALYEIRWYVHPWTVIGLIVLLLVGCAVYLFVCGVREWWNSGPYEPHHAEEPRVPQPPD